MRIIFGIGSNLGDRQFYLELAIENLTIDLELKNVKSSKIYKNKALLKPDSPINWDLEFLNLAISGDVDLKKFPPQKILEISKSIEKKLGREHRGIWAPREIDIDILAIDDVEFVIKDLLTIPHKSLFDRDFFIVTMKEIELEIFTKLQNKYSK